MKKLNILLLVILSLFLVSCGAKNKEIELFSEDTIINTNFINLSNEYLLKESNVDLHFQKDDIIPLINLKDYFKLLNGVFLSDEVEFVREGDILTISVTNEYLLGDITKEITYEAKLDLINSKLEVNDLDFFSSYLNETNTNYSEGLVNLEPVITKGSKVLYDLAKYHFNVVLKDDLVLLPLFLVNLLFSQDNYFDLYYNGNTLYGIDTSLVDNKVLKTILKSDYNNKNIPNILKEHTYNYLTLIVDYFYGLKSDRNIISGQEFISNSLFLNNDLGKEVFNFTVNLDDLHTSHISRGYFNNKRLETSYKNSSYKTNVNNFYNGMNLVVSNAASHFGTKSGYVNVKDFDIEYIDNNQTLIIYLLAFEVETPKKIEQIIKNAKDETKNIVIDLSLNTGGNLGAVLRMFTLMTNEEISYHVINPLNNERATYKVKGENAAYDNYTYAIKTSSITFSAANLTASIAKELGIKVIGKKSSGGASGVSYLITPDGSIINISSNMVLTNSEYKSIELGIEPNIILNNLYNKLEIINALN